MISGSVFSVFNMLLLVYVTCKFSARLLLCVVTAMVTDCRFACGQSTKTMTAFLVSGSGGWKKLTSTLMVAQHSDNLFLSVSRKKLCSEAESPLHGFQSSRF